MTRLKTFFSAALVVGTLSMAACEHYHPHYPDGPRAVDARVTYIDRAPPPPPRRLYVPPRPSITSVWIDGYWGWSGGVGYSWSDGYWDTNPPYRKVWLPHRWVHSDRGWYRRPGRWR